MPNPPILLRIDTLGLEAFRCHGRSLTRLAAFATGEHGAFADWLQGQPRRARYRVLLALPDESHETEALPRTSGADRRALLARRLAAWYPQPCYAKAATLAVDRKANVEQVLFSGLARPSGIEAWMRALRDTGRRCERLIPASELIAHALPGGTRLIVSFERAGMRLTVAEGHTARLSRLVEAAGTESGPYNPEWQGEIERTLHYADTLRPPLSERPQAAMLTPEAVAGHPHFQAGNAALLRLDPAGPAIPAADCGELLLHWLARAPRKLGWPGLAAERAAPWESARAFALGAGLLLFAGGTGIAGMHWQAAQSAQQHRIVLQGENARLQRERAELESAHATLDAAPAQIIETMRWVAREQAASIMPLAILQPLADSLEHTPGLRLLALEWSAVPAQDAEPALVRIRLSLAPDAAERTAPGPRHAVDIETFTARLASRGARQLDTHSASGGRTDIELLLPADHFQERDR